MTQQSTSWHFAYVADLHIGSPRSYRFRPAWNQRWQVARKQIAESNPELLILGGDLTRDGDTHRSELEQAKSDFDTLPFPYHAIPGNHDVGDKFMKSAPMSVRQESVQLYTSVFGASEWSFVHRNVRFSGFNSLLLGSGLPEEDALWQWLEQQAAQPRAEHHVWFMHSPLFVDTLHEPNRDPGTESDDWSFCIDEPHRSRILEAVRATGSKLVISAHLHCRHATVEEGTTFLFAPGIAFSLRADRWADGDPRMGWLDCEVTTAGINPRFVPLAETVEDTGSYGPTGHPPLETRDYSVAREQPPFDPATERQPR